MTARPGLRTEKAGTSALAQKPAEIRPIGTGTRNARSQSRWAQGSIEVSFMPGMCLTDGNFNDHQGFSQPGQHEISAT
jgi:hypothetical protein